jgi:[glutamine synthetase] adenylyltransferase / [glutamine synthetase]-adenylyl-L-tyrosine phosphorylase
MTNTDDLIRDLPDPGSAQRFLVQFAEKHPSHSRKLLKNGALLSDVLTLVSYSPLLAATMLQHPEHLWWLGRKREDPRVRDKDEMLESLARFSMTNTQLEPHVILSRFRRRELLRIYLRDIRRLATVAEITEEISNLADAILEHALSLARQEIDNRYGGPLETDEKGRRRPAEFCIVSLGKLGSKELNYSSDIDLLFIYSGDGSTAGVGTRGPVTNREYFNKLAETITKLAGHQIGEGAAYRVDLRLRPHGRVGPLATSLPETIAYYRDEAAAWERQVLIRSRSSAGRSAIFKKLWQQVEDSVFSVSVSRDEALRNVSESKQKIDIDNITSRETNVKLGRGGIREIEFIAQALQLAHGGVDKWIRSPHTLITLDRLRDRQLISDLELTQLSEAYTFLRQLEHILQMENGLQTHSIPNDPVRRRLLAQRMRFAGLAGFDAAFAKHSENVHCAFERVFGSPEARVSGSGVSGDDKEASRSFESGSEHKATIGDPSEFERTCGDIPRIAAMADSTPELAEVLHELTGEFSERDYSAILKTAIEAEGGLGAKLSILRRAWRRQIFEILVCDAAGRLTIAHSKQLQTALAEASIAAALEIAKWQMRQRFGPAAAIPPIAVMGLGKLGGGGLDYDSDLDLVMVYDEDRSDARGSSDNAAGLSIEEAANRVVEIFVNTLSAMTRDGSLYRVDLRLRPHGKDGPLAISRAAFADYMRENSAIWELLAFVKLRGVGGEMPLAKEIEKKIRGIIHEKAERFEHVELASETRRIRRGLEKQRVGLGRSRDIDIKYGDGGMLDIYFAIRFLQLRDRMPDDDASRSTESTLTRLKDTGSLSAAHYATLLAGYEFLSALDHNVRLTIGRTTRLPLANEKALATIAERMGVASTHELLTELTAHRLEIRSAFEEILS